MLRKAHTSRCEEYFIESAQCCSLKNEVMYPSLHEAIPALVITVFPSDSEVKSGFGVASSGFEPSSVTCLLNNPEQENSL